MVGVLNRFVLNRVYSAGAKKEAGSLNMTSNSLSTMRCMKEFKEVVDGVEMASGEIKLEMIDDDWQQLTGEIRGPTDTPYEGGRFKLLIEMPEDYPISPPKVWFLSFVWHPNVSSVTGYVCLDILKDRWVPVLSLRTVLLSLQVLLSSPEPNDPLDQVVVDQFMHDPELFDKTARYWTNVFADGPFVIPEFNEKVDHLVEMGIKMQRARNLLSKYRWNIQAAVDNAFPDEIQ